MDNNTNTNQFTGLSAQDDPAFNEDLFSDFDSLEDAISEVQGDELIDEFTKNLDYAEFLILSKKEISEFLRLVEPWSKVSVDNYGKSVRIWSVSSDTVSLQYVNSPTFLQSVVGNKSGKTMPDFFIRVDLLKKIVSESFASVVFVRENDEVNLALLNNLLYVETQNLKSAEYDYKFPEGKCLDLDLERGTFLFKKLSFALAATDRVAEKSIVIKDDKSYISTNAFVAEVDSPFSEAVSLVLFKPVVDTLGLMVGEAKTSAKVTVNEAGSLLSIVVDGKTTAVVQVHKNVDQFLNPRTQMLLNFKPNVCVENDSLLRLAQVVSSFDYLSSALSIAIEGDSMVVTVLSSDLSRKVKYSFSVTKEGDVDDVEMKIGSDLLKNYLEFAGKVARYSLQESGLGLELVNGKFLILRNG